VPRLSDLIDVEQVLDVRGSLATQVARISTDSRDVGEGDVFVCLPGYRTEGGETRADRHDFIPVAVSRGAAALVVEREVAPVPGVTVVRVADAWLTVAEMARRNYADPSQNMLVVGVTGTSGKTSTTYFIDAVLRAAGHRVARFGTIEYRIADAVLPAAQTTPEAPRLQQLLRHAVDAGCTAAVMEVSSHALELRRVAGIAFDLAVFTNLSRDHLNFHPDMHHYVRAKGRLFEELASRGKSGTAIVNLDDPASEYIRSVNAGGLKTYARHAPADVSARDVEASLDGLRFTLVTPAGTRGVRLAHLGEYSVYNALAAAAVASELGIDLETIAAGLAATPPIPGRFELVDAGQDFVVAVDYAHKPDALQRVLESARNLGARRLITVFGCGGDRDHGKRPLMGRIALELSDHVIVTSDNPRSEDPRAVVEDILGGARAVDPHAQRHVAEVDRASAIRCAVDMAGAGDLVLIAGKGHETYQLIGGQRLHFDDREQARAALERRSATRHER
jgi:UDP-N-acetylmuramoyl-L-alanyl-D-glutamate--2,6-diaminopimelate ligase